MQLDARDLLRDTSVHADLTTSHALSQLLCEHLSEQGLSVPLLYLQDMLHIDNEIPVETVAGVSRLRVRYTAPDTGDESVDDHYDNLLEGFFEQQTPGLSWRDGAASELERSLRMLYEAKHVTFAPGPRRHDVYVILDRAVRPALPVGFDFTDAAAFAALPDALTYTDTPDPHISNTSGDADATSDLMRRVRLCSDALVAHIENPNEPEPIYDFTKHVNNATPEERSALRRLAQLHLDMLTRRAEQADASTGMALHQGALRAAITHGTGELNSAVRLIHALRAHPQP